MAPLLAPLTVEDLVHADALGDGKLTDANLLAVAMDKLPAEVEAMPYPEGRPYMDELAAQLADGGALVNDADGLGGVTLTLKHPTTLPDEPGATQTIVRLRPMTVGDVYGARAAVGSSEIGQDLSLLATLSGASEAFLRRVHVGDYMRLADVLADFFAPPSSSPPTS